MSTNKHLEKLFIRDLPFTEDLKTILYSAGITNLSQLLQIYVNNWPERIQGFTAHHQQQIIAYLHSNKLTHFLLED